MIDGNGGFGLMSFDIGVGNNLKQPNVIENILL